GDFFKPAADSAPDAVITMAPLIVREAEGRFADVPFGIRVGPVEDTTDAERVIYYFEDDVTVSGRRHGRYTFLWQFGRPDGAGSGAPAAQGFRMTLDDAGYALVWEAIDASSPRVMYVARSLEVAAAAEFGAPAAQRRYAIEQPIERAPETVVARILSDGPQPMGPFVYIDGDAHEFTTLLCRCMASQVDAFRETATYTLRPLPATADGDAPLSPFAALLRHANARTLDELLRLPSVMTAPK